MGFFTDFFSNIVSRPFEEVLIKGFFKKIGERSGEVFSDHQLKVLMSRIFGPNTEDERRFNLAMSYLDPNDQKRIWDMLNSLESHQSDYFRICVMNDDPEQIAKVLKQVYVPMDEEAWRHAIRTMNYDLQQISSKWDTFTNWCATNWRTYVWPALLQLGWRGIITGVFFTWFVLKTNPAQVASAINIAFDSATSKFGAAANWVVARVKELAGFAGPELKSGIKSTATVVGKGIAQTAKAGWWGTRYALAIPLFLIGGVLAIFLLLSAFPALWSQVGLLALVLLIPLAGLAGIVLLSFFGQGMSWPVRWLLYAAIPIVAILLTSLAMPQLGIVLLVLGVAVAFALAGLLTGRKERQKRNTAAWFLRVVAGAVVVAVLIFAFLIPIGAIFLPAGMQTWIGDAKDASVRSAVIWADQFGVQQRRAEIPAEADAKQTFAKVTQATPVFSITFYPNTGGVKSVEKYQGQDGTNLILSPGRLVKTTEVRPAVTYAGESVLEVLLPDRDGTFVSTGSDRLFVPERFLELQNRTVKQTPGKVTGWGAAGSWALPKILIIWIGVALVLLAIKVFHKGSATSAAHSGGSGNGH